MNHIIRSNSNGQLSYDAQVKEFTVEFGNVYFKLPMDAFELFEKQLENMSNDLSMYASNQRLMVPVAGTAITLLLTPEEMISLKNLFGIQLDKSLSFKLNINYSMN